MDGKANTIGGIVIPSTDPVFLAVVIGVHIPLGIACVVTGASAMDRRHRKGREEKNQRRFQTSPGKIRMDQSRLPAFRSVL